MRKKEKEQQLAAKNAALANKSTISSTSAKDQPKKAGFFTKLNIFGQKTNGAPSTATSQATGKFIDTETASTKPLSVVKPVSAASISTSNNAKLFSTTPVAPTQPKINVIKEVKSVNAIVIPSEYEKDEDEELEDGEIKECEEIEVEMEESAAPVTAVIFSPQSQSKVLSAAQTPQASVMKSPVLMKSPPPVMQSPQATKTPTQPALMSASKPVLKEITLENLQMHNQIHLSVHNASNNNIPVPTEKPKLMVAQEADDEEPRDEYIIKPRDDSDDDSTSDSTEDGQDDAEGGEKKKPYIPEWAKGELLKKALEKQFGLHGGQPMDPDSIFPEVQTCSLEEIFGRREGLTRKYANRTSSAHWDADQLTLVEKRTYRSHMGYD